MEKLQLHMLMERLKGMNGMINLRILGQKEVANSSKLKGGYNMKESLDDYMSAMADVDMAIFDINHHIKLNGLDDGETETLRGKLPELKDYALRISEFVKEIEEKVK